MIHDALVFTACLAFLACFNKACAVDFLLLSPELHPVKSN